MIRNAILFDRPAFISWFGSQPTCLEDSLEFDDAYLVVHACRDELLPFLAVGHVADEGLVASEFAVSVGG